MEPDETRLEEAILAKKDTRMIALKASMYVSTRRGLPEDSKVGVLNAAGWSEAAAVPPLYL